MPTAIVDRAAVFRAGLTHICSGSRFRINYQPSTVGELPADFFAKKLCQLLLISLDEGDYDVPAQIRVLKSQCESLRVCVLADWFKPHELLAAIEAGADGLLLKREISADTFLRSLELILLGEVVISSRLVQLINGYLRAPQDAPLEAGLDQAEYRPLMAISRPAQGDAAVQLSGRERAILLQLTQGACNKRIARELGIAEATIKVHIRSLLRKIRVTNRTQAAMWAVNYLGVADGHATENRSGEPSESIINNKPHRATRSALPMERAGLLA